MKLGPETAAVLRKASRGPAAIALRHHRLTSGVRPPAFHNNLVRGGSVGHFHRPGVGALGAAPPVTAGVSAGASYAAGAGATAAASSVGAAGYTAIGSAAGPIGAVVGAIVGLVVTKLLTKHYLNVGQANQAAEASVQIFNHYQSIAGQIPGRTLGLPAMDAIWKGALYSGYFPLNNQQLCFHEGCLQYRGQPEWIEAVINGPENAFTLGTAFAAMMNATATRAAPPAAAPVYNVFGTRVGVAPAYSVFGVRPTAGEYGAPAPAYGPVRSYGLRGLGALGLIHNTPEAVVLVDQYLIPANTHDNPPWVVPRSSFEHQILYDVADAWLATKHPELNSTPYIARPPASSAIYPVPGAPAAPTLPAPSPVPIVSPALPVVPPSGITPAVVGTGAGGGFFLNPSMPYGVTPGPAGAGGGIYYGAGGNPLASVIRSASAPGPAGATGAQGASPSILPAALLAALVFMQR